MIGGRYNEYLRRFFKKEAPLLGLQGSGGGLGFLAGRGGPTLATGGTKYTYNNKIIHVFTNTGPNPFIVPKDFTAEVFVVGGGGGGGYFGGGGGAAAGAARVWRGPGRRLVALHLAHDRLWRGRNAYGPIGRPHWAAAGVVAWCIRGGQWLCVGQHVSGAGWVFAGPWRAVGAAGQLHHVCAAVGRYFVVVA